MDTIQDYFDIQDWQTSLTEVHHYKLHGIKSHKKWPIIIYYYSNLQSKLDGLSAPSKTELTNIFPIADVIYEKAEPYIMSRDYVAFKL